MKHMARIMPQDCPKTAFSGDGDCLAAELRPGNVHSADGALEFVKPLVNSYVAPSGCFGCEETRPFALPDVYDYCEKEHLTYFIRLPMSDTLRKIMEPDKWAGRPSRPSRCSASNFTTGRRWALAETETPMIDRVIRKGILCAERGGDRYSFPIRKKIVCK